MFHYMMVNEKDVLSETTPEGVRRAATEKYAFLMESSQIEYEIERECSLTQIGKPIDDKGYGIAMKKGASMYTNEILIRTNIHDGIPFSQDRVILDYLVKVF